MNDKTSLPSEIADTKGNGTIRLGCVHCDRRDQEGISMLPESWESIASVQEWVGTQCDLVTETHLGICPQCIEVFERSDAPDPGPPPWEQTEDEKNPDYQRLLKVHPIVSQIVNRDCHVGSEAKSVVQHVVAKLRNGAGTLRAMTPADRRKLIDDCIVQHRHNWKEYVEVMSGFTHTTGSQAGAELPSSLTGKKVTSLMRKHKMTIEQLAFRLGTSMKRVRQIRESGLTDPLAVRDWIQAIIGVDPGPIPEKFRIANRQEEGSCCFCGYPLFVDDEAFDYVGEMFCSTTCAQKSRGW